MSITEDTTIYNPLTSTSIDLASTITSRYFPLCFLFGILAVPVLVLAIPTVITSKILDARRSGQGALAHSMQMAVCAWTFAMVFVYLFCGIVLFGLILTVLVLTFSSFPLLAFSSKRRFATPHVFLYENIFRYLVSWCFAITALGKLPDADHDDWWIYALIGCGIFEVFGMYCRWKHISGYPLPPPREETILSDVESVDAGLGPSYVDKSFD